MGSSKMILNVILILIILKLSRCSLVFDAMTQNTLYVSNYCPAMKHCKEGTHVMCMYYDQERTLGQHCKNYVKFTITPQMVYQILQEVNYIRLKVATGKEIGKGGLPLPRAYGMMKMFWDSELATLAQVLADQCLGLKEDQCRSTDKFTNPSQVITLINFKVPNWDYLTRNTTTRGLTKEKISFAIEKALKSLHAVKKLVDSNTIYDCPAMEQLPDMGSRSYLKLIRGKATHIGCGMSAYTRFQILHSGAENIYNSVQIVCNISDGPQQSQPLYTTDPPIPGTGFTEHCGCPQGYQETEGCLCEPKPHNTPSTMNPYKWQPHFDNDKNDQQPETTPCVDPNGNCGQRSKVVVLPIFSIQDYPTEPYEAKNNVEAQFHRRFGNLSFLPSETSLERNEISDENYEEKPSYTKTRKNNISYIQRRKMIPSKPLKTDLKIQNNAVQTEKVTTEIIGTEKYDESYNSLEDNVFDHSPHSIRTHDYEEKNVVDDVYNDNDNTFLTLLDSLERAVKTVELEGDEREIFDLKMRKIYEAALKTKMKTSTTTVRTTTTMKFKTVKTHRITTKPSTLKPDEIENDYHEIKDYLKTKSERPFEEERKSFEPRTWSDDAEKINQNTIIDNNMNEELNHVEQKEKNNESDEFEKNIDDKLMHILNKKDNRGNYDYFGNKHSGSDHYYNVDRLYEKTGEYNKLLLSRNQQNIDKYYDHLKEDKGKSILDLHNHNMLRTNNGHPSLSKKIGSEEHTKTMEAGIKKPTFEVKQAMKTFGRRTFSFPKKNIWKIHDFGYRPIIESEPERPTLPIWKNPEIVKTEPHKDKYYLSDRATL